MKKRLSTIVLSSLLATSAFAGGREPGSLLIFPIFDSTPGHVTIITVTNTNSDSSYDPATGLQRGAIDIEYRYISGSNCAEFNRVERLTANDTLSVIAAAHNTSSTFGYVYVFAKNPLTQVPVSFNHLAGHLRVIDSVQGVESIVSPVTLFGMTCCGLPTDLDGDHILDLDDQEYESVGDQLVFPSFIGEIPVMIENDLVLVNLTGGTKFTATADFLIYNDNEEVFSAELPFSCWIKAPLSYISGAFTMAYLATTHNDPRELVGAPTVETGWFRVDGGVASSSVVTLDDPAMVGMLLERIGRIGGSELPYEIGKQQNGDLLPRNVFGDS
ncbi:MAG: hypothetical protein U1E76_05575 [Planctomycetota bacterium]